MSLEFDGSGVWTIGYSSSRSLTEEEKQKYVPDLMDISPFIDENEKILADVKDQFIRGGKELYGIEGSHSDFICLKAETFCPEDQLLVINFFQYRPSKNSQDTTDTISSYAEKIRENLKHKESISVSNDVLGDFTKPLLKKFFVVAENDDETLSLYPK